MKLFRYILSVIFVTLIFSSNVFAKVINLQEQPKADSKVVGTVDTAAGIITVFTPKDGSGWIKVADPRNGNVGWIKSADLANGGFSFNVMTSGDGPARFQVIQYGNTKPYSEAQMSEMMKKMQRQQDILQKDMNQMMRDMFQNLNQWVTFPVMMPVLVTPKNSVTPAQQSPTVSKPVTQAPVKTTTTKPASN